MTVDEAQLVAAAAGALAGLIVGALIAWMIALGRINAARLRAEVLAAQLSSRDDMEDERHAMLELAGDRLTATFDALASRSLDAHSRHFLRLAEENFTRHQEKASANLEEKRAAVERLVGPVSEALEKTRAQMAALEKDRHAALGGVAEQLRQTDEINRRLQTETANLVAALRRPEVRGRWGEMTLRRVVELSGMVEHCDFEEQVHRSTDDGHLRPDMVVRLPEKRSLVVDAKTPLDAYLAAIEATEDAPRQEALARHARHIRERIRELAAKAYWQQFRTSPEFVILFLPGDQFLSQALAVEPEILDDALRQKVIVATPSSLVALLKTVGYGWRQLELSRNAEVIRDLGEVLHQRLAVFTTHLAKLGTTLKQSVDTYNRAVGSLERQVLPGARRFTELGVTARRDIAPLTEVDTRAREPALADETTDAGDESG